MFPPLFSCTGMFTLRTPNLFIRNTRTCFTPFFVARIGKLAHITSRSKDEAHKRRATRTLRQVDEF